MQYGSWLFTGSVQNNQNNIVALIWQIAMLRGIQQHNTN